MLHSIEYTYVCLISIRICLDNVVVEFRMDVLERGGTTGVSDQGAGKGGSANRIGLQKSLARALFRSRYGKGDYLDRLPGNFAGARTGQVHNSV